jgi:hypothetical protein
VVLFVIGAADPDKEVVGPYSAALSVDLGIMRLVSVNSRE